MKPDRPFLTSLVCLLHAKHIGKDRVKCLYVLIHFTLTKFTNTLGIRYYYYPCFTHDQIGDQMIYCRERCREREGGREKREREKEMRREKSGEERGQEERISTSS